MKGIKEDLIAIIMGLAIVCAPIVIMQLTGVTEKVDTQQYDLLKTVAHLDLSNRDDLELVAVDAEQDIAYYRYVKPEKNIDVGSEVNVITGATGTVTSTDAVGFTFSTEDAITAGDSGLAVMSNDVQVGYLSQRLPSGDYRVIWN